MPNLIPSFFPNRLTTKKQAIVDVLQFFLSISFHFFGLHAVTLLAKIPTLSHDIDSLIPTSTSFHFLSIWSHINNHSIMMVDATCHPIWTKIVLTTVTWNQGALSHPIRMGLTSIRPLKFNCMIEQCNTKIYLEITTTIIAVYIFLPFFCSNTMPLYK